MNASKLSQVSTTSRPRLTKKAVDGILDANPSISRKDSNRVTICGPQDTWDVYYSSRGDSFSATTKDGNMIRSVSIDVKPDGVYLAQNGLDVYAPSYYRQESCKRFDGKVPATESMRVGMNVLGSIVGIPFAMLSPDMATNVHLKQV